MEELLIKYMFDECSSDEKAQIEIELKSNPDLIKEMNDLKKLDQIMNFKNLLLPASTELKLRILDRLIPSIQLEQNSSKSYFDYILPTLFGLGSVIYLLYYADPSASNKWSQYINSDYLKYFSLGGMSMVGLLILDQLITKKEYKSHILA